MENSLERTEVWSFRGMLKAVWTATMTNMECLTKAIKKQNLIKFILNKTTLSIAWT